MRKAIYCLAALALAAPVYAQHDHAPPTSTKVVQEMAQGEVRKVDKPASKVTLKHGPIASVDMPPMTMTFSVTDPKGIDRFAPGDKVRFAAEKRGEEIVVTKIEKAK